VVANACPFARSPGGEPARLLAEGRWRRGVGRGFWRQATPKEFAMTEIAAPFAPAPGAPETEHSRIHPLFHAGKWLVSDLLSTFVFVGLYAATHSIYAATGLAIAGGIGQIAWLKLRRQPIDLMQWMSLGLVLVFGTASLVTHDPRFVMLKPTLIYCALGAVMLKRGWMNRYIPLEGARWASDIVTVFGYVWSGMMFATAGLNLILVANGDVKTWAWFLGVFPLASKLGLFAVQYITMRMIIGRRVRAAGAV
jgi:intracellular septation protein A